MLDIKIHSDIQKANEGTIAIAIHAAGTLPELCAELEVFAAEMVRGLSRQMPPGQEGAARTLFSIAVVEGARKGLKDDMT